MRMLFNLIQVVSIVLSMSTLQAEVIEIHDQRTNKTITFTDEFTEQSFQEVVDFLVIGHAQEYQKSGRALPLKFEELARAHWASYYVQYFLQQQPAHQGHLITAHVEGRLVGACAYYCARVLFREIEVPTLCILDIFSECEIYEPRSFMKGYRSLALQQCPQAMYWLVGVHEDAFRYPEAFRQAGFKKTSVQLPHMSDEQLDGLTFFKKHCAHRSKK